MQLTYVTISSLFSHAVLPCVTVNSVHWIASAKMCFCNFCRHWFCVLIMQEL